MRLMWFFVVLLLAGCSEPAVDQPSTSLSELPGLAQPTSEQSPVGSNASTPKAPPLPTLYTEPLARRDVQEFFGRAQYSGGIASGPSGCIGPMDSKTFDIPAQPTGTEVTHSLFRVDWGAGGSGRATLDDGTQSVTISDGEEASFNSAIATTLVLETCTSVIAPTAVWDRTVLVPNAHPYVQGNLVYVLDNPQSPEPEPLARTVYPTSAMHTARFGGDTGTQISVQGGLRTKAYVVDEDAEHLATLTAQNGVFTAAQLGHLEGETSRVEAEIDEFVRHLEVGDLDNDGSSGWDVTVANVQLDSLVHPKGFGNLFVTNASIQRMEAAPGSPQHIHLKEVHLGTGPHFIGGCTCDVTMSGVATFSNHVEESSFFFTDSSTLYDDEAGAATYIDARFGGKDVAYRFYITGINDLDRFQVELPGITMELFENNTARGESPNYDAALVQVEVTGRFEGIIRPL